MAVNIAQRAFKIFRENGPVGLGSAICRFFYWNTGIRSVYLRILHKLHDSTAKIQIQGIDVEFSTNTVSEFDRFRDLKGEKETIADLISELRTDDTFYDVGANVGLYSCFAAKTLPDNSVFAFEPHPANIQALEKNAQNNEIKLTICEYGLSDKSGEFILNEQSSQAGEGKHALAGGEETDGLKVDVKTIDQITEGELDIPTAVKIDVEGAEHNVLKGGEKVLSADSCRLLYCELHPEKMEDYDSDYQSVVSFIQELGFETELIEGSPGEYSMLKGKK